MRPAKRYAVFIAAFMLLTSVVPCTAALVESRQTQAFLLDTVRYTEYAPLRYPPLPTYTTSQTVSFAPFNPALGTLKNAYVSFQSTHGIEYVVKAGVRDLTGWESFWSYFWSGPVAGFASYDYSLSVTAPGTSAAIKSIVKSDHMTTEIQGNASTSKYGGMYWYNVDGSGPKDMSGDWTVDGKYLFQPWVTAGNLDTPLISLADGLNVTGGSVNVILQKEISLFMLPFLSSFEDPDGDFHPVYSCVDNYLNKWSGTVALTYVYETGAPVPLPGTLLLLAPGALALGLLRRRFIR